MKCINCGNETYQATTTDVTDTDNCLIIVRHVPCFECPVCGEIHYNGVTAKKLEKLTEIANSITNDITVIDYSKNAA